MLLKYLKPDEDLNHQALKYLKPDEDLNHQALKPDEDLNQFNQYWYTTSF